MTTATDALAAVPASERWWSGVVKGQILLLRCPQCGAHWVPWAPHCPDCGVGQEPQWVASCGLGTLYSWVVIRHSVGFPDEVPFVVGSVLLDEGGMLYGRVSADPGDLRGDMRVKATYVDRNHRTVVDFIPSEPPGTGSGPTASQLTA